MDARQMTRIAARSALVGAMLLCTHEAAAQELRVDFKDDLVTVVASDVPLLQILQRWAANGDATLVNERAVGNTPVTVQLVGVPQKEALNILLRDVNGYILMPRRETSRGASLFDRMIFTARSTASQSPAARPAAGGVFQAPVVSQIETAPDIGGTPDRPEGVPAVDRGTMPGIVGSVYNPLLRAPAASQAGTTTTGQVPTRPGEVPRPAPRPEDPASPAPMKTAAGQGAASPSPSSTGTLSFSNVTARPGEMTPAPADPEQVYQPPAPPPPPETPQSPDP
jgi:hypothetical protein